MMNLTEALERWADLSPSERDALVAVHVRGWRKEKTTGNWVLWVDSDGNSRGLFTLWNPTTDHNDMVAAVRAFKKQYGPEFRGGLCRRGLRWDRFGQLLWESPRLELLRITITEQDGHDWDVVNADDLGSMFTIKPPEVCHAMLQALEESEGDDVR
jgi:hypothetical protein